MSVQLLPADPPRFGEMAEQARAFSRRDEEAGAQKQAAVLVAGMLVSLYFHYLHAAAGAAQGGDDTRSVTRTETDSHAFSASAYSASRADALAFETARSQGEAIRLIGRVFQDHLIEQGQANDKAALARSLATTAARAHMHKQQAEREFNGQRADLQVAASRTRGLPASMAQLARNIAIAAGAAMPPLVPSERGIGSVSVIARK